MKSSTYVGMALLTLLAMVALAAPVNWGSNEGVRTMFNAPLLWVPRDSAAREEFNRFLGQFEIHEAILISWPGCTVDDPRLEEVEEALMAVRDSRAAAGEVELFNHVVSGRSMLQMLREAPAELNT